jgi:hypothetical protein
MRALTLGGCSVCPSNALNALSLQRPSVPPTPSVHSLSNNPNAEDEKNDSITFQKGLQIRGRNIRRIP